MKTILKVTLLVAVLAGCSHDIEIMGKGHVLSASGDNDCYAEESPCEVVVVHDYLEDYTALPNEGWAFDRWENCPDPQGNVCHVDAPASLVRAAWGMESDLKLEAHFYKENKLFDYNGKPVFRIQVTTEDGHTIHLHSFFRRDGTFEDYYTSAKSYDPDYLYFWERAIDSLVEDEDGWVATMRGVTIVFSRGEYTVVMPGAGDDDDGVTHFLRGTLK